MSGGVTLESRVSDPKKRLETAYDDLRHFLAAGKVSNEKSSYIIETARVSNINREAFRLEIGPKSCRILASDIEGIRHGIFNLEDEMLRQRGPFLSLGTVEKDPYIKERISRCFFGPIKRFPKMKDELMDDVIIILINTLTVWHMKGSMACGSL